MKGRWIIAAGLLAALASAAPHAALAQGPASAPAPAAPADVRFVQDMLAHHAQALEMTALVPARAARSDVRLMAERIEVSQRAETDRMRQWLHARGLSPDAADAHHAHHPPASGAGHAAHGAADPHAGMPGMASPEEMAGLAAASGAAFDARFLELMIRHHEGALVMVEQLFGTPGGGQESGIYDIAGEVDADQRMEIRRMRAMQDGPADGARPR